jgi:hypothetical protein
MSLMGERTEAPLIIAGMHRSGTSLLASLVRAAGVHLGADLIPPDEHNPRGYFEDAGFVQLEREMIAGACTPGQSGWADWGWTEDESLDERAFDRYRARATALVELRAGAAPWGWKDPRASLLLDFWLDVVPGARFLLVYRRQQDVAASIGRLGGPFEGHPDWPHRIWRFYNRRLLGFRRRNPSRTALVNIAAVVASASGLADLLAGLLQRRTRMNIPLMEVFDPGLLRAARPPDRPVRTASETESARLFEELEAAADLPASRPVADAPYVRR